MSNDDDELIERLRRTLHNEAAAITPNPEGRPAAPYPAPLRRHDPRPRWPLALAAAAAVAAAIVVASLTIPSGGHPSRIGILGSVTSTTLGSKTGQTVTPSTLTTPPTTVMRVVGPTATTSPTATTIPVAATPVPAGFAPDAVTFVSPSEGWVAGTIRCGAATCLALARTYDGGRTWQAAAAPGLGTDAVATGDGAGPAISVRFANAMDGWIYAQSSSSSTRFELWSTHDGGITWNAVQLALLSSGSQIVGMEAGGGHVYVALLPGANSTTVQIESSLVHTDSWSDTDTGVQIGAGPVPSVDLVLQNGSGWLIEDDRTVVGGARLTPAGGWTAWTAPCAKANGVAVLAASSSTAMVAVCNEGVWGPADNLPAGTTVPSDWVFTSADGGTGFQAVGALPSNLSLQSVATPAPATVVVGGSPNVPSGGPIGVLSATFDGGQTWQTVYQAAGIVSWSDLGFTTVTQGVAIGSTSSGSQLLMTRDGGRSWVPVSW